MQETTFNAGQDIKKNSEFHRKENNNLPIVVSSKRMRKKYKKIFLLVKREGSKGTLVNSQYILATSLAKRS